MADALQLFAPWRSRYRGPLDLSPPAIGTAGAAAHALVRSTRPDVVLMDIRMPGVDGLEATRRIAADADLPASRILVLTTFELDEYVFEALRGGASGFLVKHTEPGALVRAVRELARGDALLSPSVTPRLIAEFASRPVRPDHRAGRRHGRRRLAAPIAPAVAVLVSAFLLVGGTVSETGRDNISHPSHPGVLLALAAEIAALANRRARAHRP